MPHPDDFALSPQEVRGLLQVTGLCARGGLAPHRRSMNRAPWFASEWVALWLLHGLPYEEARLIDGWIRDVVASELRAWGVESAPPVHDGAVTRMSRLDGTPLWPVGTPSRHRAVIAYCFAGSETQPDHSRLCRRMIEMTGLLPAAEQPPRECLWLRTVDLDTARLLAWLSRAGVEAALRDKLPPAEREAFDVELDLARARFRDDLLGVRDNRLVPSDGNPLMCAQAVLAGQPSDAHLHVVTLIEDASRFGGALPANLDDHRRHSAYCQHPPANFGVVDDVDDVPGDFLANEVDESGMPLGDDFREAQWRVKEILRHRRGTD